MSPAGCARNTPCEPAQRNGRSPSISVAQLSMSAMVKVRCVQPQACNQGPPGPSRLPNRRPYGAGPDAASPRLTIADQPARLTHAPTRSLPDTTPEKIDFNSVDGCSPQALLQIRRYGRAVATGVMAAVMWHPRMTARRTVTVVMHRQAPVLYRRTGSALDPMFGTLIRKRQRSTETGVRLADAPCLLDNVPVPGHAFMVQLAAPHGGPSRTLGSTSWRPGPCP
jgi:hypothetical protein